MTGFDPEKITHFARTNARGQDVKFGIKAKDRQRHMYVIGKTGMGKSTLLENMAAQDIQSGEGMCFIDPHGSAIEVLLEYVPPERIDDVVYFAPFDMDNPISFNIMEDVGIDTRHLVVSGLMSTFKKIWEDAWSARMEYILTNALLALIEYPNTTLLSVNRMLADKTYRDKVIDHVKDPAVKAYWVDEFNNYTERFAAEALPAIQNKIGQFTGNPLIRNIIGQPHSSFDVRKMMDEKKILLVNLSKGLVGETNADLLGSMLITKIYLAAMSRAELPPAQMKQMPNFYFYVDEFQSFANSTFANILSEARKYHLNLIIAHQYVAQMEEKIRDAVFGNVGTTVTFRVGPFDAEVLEPIFAPQFEATDLVNLGAYQIYLTLMIDGAGSPPFSAATLPPVQTPPQSHKQMVIKRSQENYCKPRSEVEEIVNNLHTPDERTEASEKGEGANHGGFTKPSAFFKVGKDKEFVKQKERLKDGGSRLKGPAQTPAGTGKKPEAKKAPAAEGARPEPRPRANTDRYKREEDKKPVQPAKTPEDLKAVLAGMANKSKTPEPKLDEPKTQRAPRPSYDNNIQTNVEIAPKTEGAPTVGSSDHKNDLKAALAGLNVSEQKPKEISKKTTDSEKPQSSLDKDARQTGLETRSRSPHPRRENRKRPERPEELKQSEKGSQTETKKITNEVIRPVENKKIDHQKDVRLHNLFSKKNEAVTTAPTKENDQAKQASVRSVVVERRPQIPFAMRRPVTLTSSSNDVSDASGVTQTANKVTERSVVTGEQTPPSINEVKKILRHSGNDRLPGMK